MKTFVWTFIVVVIGVYVFNKVTGAKTAPTGTITFGPISITPAGSNVYTGPDVDPMTGSYTPPGAQGGTVAYPVQPVV